MIGEIVGQYRIVASLGSGGMGVVWKAIDTRLNRPVAVKAIRDADASSGDTLLRLRAEALAAASLDHPYICKIYELLETATATLVVMEFVEGETLEDLLARQTPALADTLRYGSEIAEGLANAHARGLVHRDVKPANVMVTIHNHIKLLDFGIARVTSSDATTQIGLTRAGSTIGTAHYMAPEQALGKQLDGRADLFSLGVLLFKSLTGQLPFEGATRDAYVQQMLSRPVRPLDALVPTAPQAVRDIVKACLERDPSRRPESAKVVADTLRRAADALSSGTLPLVYPPSRALPRWAMQLAFLAFAAAAVFLGLRQWTKAGSDEAGPRALVPAVTWPSAEFGARISPDGKWLSFISDRQNQVRVYVQAIGGGDAVPVAAGGRPVSHTWAPDGREIAIVVEQGNQLVLTVVPAFFGGSPRLTIPLDRVYFGPTVIRWLSDTVYVNVNNGKGHTLLAFALNGTRAEDVSARWPGPIPFTSIDVAPGTKKLVMDATIGGRKNLWTSNLDGSNLQLLTDDGFVNRSPLWLTDSSVAFESSRGGQMDLWQISTLTKRATQLTSSMMGEAPTAASTDGTIAFDQRADTVNLWRLTLGSGDTRQLTGDALSDYWPSVSRDAKRVAFQRARPTPAEGSQFLDARVMVADAAPDALEPQVIADGFGPRLSPDGMWVAYYQRLPDPKRLRLVVKHLATGESRTLSDHCELPSYSPNPPVDWGSQTLTWGSASDLYYVVVTGDRRVIERADLGGTAAASQLATSGPGGAIRDLRMSIDGTMLAYLSWQPGPQASAAVSGPEVRVHYIRDNHDAVVSREPGPLGEVHASGWWGNALILLRAKYSPAGVYELQVTELGLDGARKAIATIPDSFAATLRIDEENGRLYVTRAAGGIHNIHLVTFADGRIRTLTSNQTPGVSFSGIQPLGKDAIIFARDERKADIWLLQRR